MNQIATGRTDTLDARALAIPFPRWTAIEVWTVRNGHDWAEISVGRGQDDMGCPWTSISAFSSQGRFAFAFPEGDFRDWRWRTEEMQRDETLRFMAGADGLRLDFDATLAQLRDLIADREVASFADHVRLRQAEELARGAFQAGRDTEAADLLLDHLSDLVPHHASTAIWGPGERTRAFRDLLWTPFCEAMQQDVCAAWKAAPLRQPDDALVAREQGRDWALVDGHLARVGQPLPAPDVSFFEGAPYLEDEPAFALAP